MAPTPEQVAFFEEQGYLVIQDLIPPEWLRQIQEETTDLHERMADNPPEGVHVSWEHEVDPTIRRKIKQLMHGEAISPALNRLVRSAEVLDVIELLMKAARCGTITPWHQDYSYWVDADNRPLMMNCMMQIDSSSAENGCLQV